MTSTKQRTYEGLKYRIITQQLAPGELLKDKDIMERYGIGRTPLREVFLELQNEGLIKRIPRSGTWVAPMDFKFLKQITEIRIGLEGIAGELAAERITEEELHALTGILENVAALEIENGVDGEALLKHESDFHNVIYSSTGNPQLEKLLRNYQSVGARFWHYLVFSKEQMFDQFKSQRLLLDALKKRDKKTSRRIAEEHIRSYMGIIEERIDLR
ncbi:GntR family transcriptional regulator [Desulfosediminicola ganghwensis]|uniref:GntR family transcriptional regulator n=1 Tax=Desulfosediminicola ganghwensis TaxID=2569540 RepID=UPI0010ACF146|nr:GntR family transcriptional regulator [Desulfosediminicola ganghwensis]